MTIKVITPKEHKEWLKKKISKDGIVDSIQEQLDEWVDICHSLGYLGFSEAIERAQNITDLLNTYIKMKHKNPTINYEKPKRHKQ